MRYGRTRTAGRGGKLHLGVDAVTGQIVAASLTSKEVDDAAKVGPLLDQVAMPVASFTADGAYDQDRVYIDVSQGRLDAAVVAPPRVTAATTETVPSQRDRHLQTIARHDRLAWQKQSGYAKPARIEATMSRSKQVIGDD
jgi:hypothetical protein